MISCNYDRSFLGQCGRKNGRELGDVEIAIIMASLGG
jgi:hypothetical protein